jgi:hypothetical protein
VKYDHKFIWGVPFILFYFWHVKYDDKFIWGVLFILFFLLLPCDIWSQNHLGSTIYLFYFCLMKYDHKFIWGVLFIFFLEWQIYLWLHSSMHVLYEHWYSSIVIALQNPGLIQSWYTIGLRKFICFSFKWGLWYSLMGNYNGIVKLDPWEASSYTFG